MVGKGKFANAAAVLLAGVLALAVIPGCGSSQQSSTATQQQDGTAETTVTSSEKQAKDAFDSSEKFTLEVAGAVFQVPSYFQKNSDDSDSSTANYLAESGNDKVALLQGSQSDDVSATANEISSKKQDIIDSWVDDLNEGAYENVTSSNVNDTTVAGMPGFTFTLEGTYSNVEITGVGVYYFNQADDSAGRLLLWQTETTDYDYTSDFDKIVASAVASSSTSASASEEKSSSSSSSSAKKKSSKSQVSPKFKKTMDSYEKFFKKYASFMKKYKKNPTDTSLLSDYASMMSEYSDMYSSYQDIDTDDLSAADLAYYTKVNARIVKILADVM